MKFIYLAITISLISACATTKYLGTEQPSLAAHACSIETKQCFMSTTAVERSGSDTSINGSWFLDDLGSGSYYLHGSVKLSISKVSASKIEFLD